MTMPIQKPGRSKQDYSTPADLIRAVELRFGPLAWDLAASAENAKAPNWIGKDRDSLSVDWSRLDGLKWCNPPFGRIAPWAAKCPTGRRVLFLTPASTDTKWYRDAIHDRALVLFLYDRLTFGGAVGRYPKGCMISAFGMGRTGFEVWDWRETLKLAKAA